MAILLPIRLRRGTAAQWTAANTLLASGEPAYETDTKKLKIGDGSTRWNDLKYFLPETLFQAVVAELVTETLESSNIPVIDDETSGLQSVYSGSKVDELFTSLIKNSLTSATATWSSTKISSFVAGKISDITGTPPANLATIEALANAITSMPKTGWSEITDRPNFVAAGPTPADARAVIDVPSTTEVGTALASKVESSDFENEMSTKADLSSGKVPKAQLPNPGDFSSFDADVQDTIVSQVIADAAAAATDKLYSSSKVAALIAGRAPVPSQTWIINPLTGRVHVPFIEPTVDAGAILMSAYNYATANGAAGLQLGPYKYYCTTKLTWTKPLSVFGSVMPTSTTQKAVEGTGGTVVIDATPTNSPDTFWTIGQTDDAIPNIMNWSLENFRIVGKQQSDWSIYPKHDGLALIHSGWEFTSRNLYIGRFQGRGLYLDRCYDSNHFAMTIVSCGGIIDGQVRYALDLDSSTGSDCTNAQHFHGLHMEACRYYKRFERARHIFFTNSKFEQNGYFDPKSFDTDVTNSPIIYGANTQEISYSSCMFVGSNTSLWQSVNPGLAADSIPYYFKSLADKLDGSSAILFGECHFTNGLEPGGTGLRGVKWMTGTSFMVGDSSFDFCTSEGSAAGTAFNVSKSHFDNVRFVIGTYGHNQGGSAGIFNAGVNAKITSSHWRTDGAGSCKVAVVLNGAGSAVAGATLFENVVRPVIGGGTSGGEYQGLQSMETITPSVYASHYGNTPSAPFSFAFDPSQHSSSVLSLNFSGAVTVTSLTASQNTRGRIITLHNASTTDNVTVNGSSSVDAATILPGALARFMLVGSKWTRVIDATSGGSSSGFNPTVLPPIGSFVTGQEIVSSVNATLTSGKCSMHPITLRAGTYDALVVALTTAQSGGTTVTKLALYADDGSNGAPLMDGSGPLASATIDLNTAAVGQVIGTFASPKVLADGRYWLAVFYYAPSAPGAAPQLSMISAGSWSLPFASTISPATRLRGRVRSGLTDLPADTTAFPVSGSNDVPVVGIRRSA